MQLALNDLKITFDTQGTGPDLLLLHGWGGNRHTWGSLPSLLTHRYRATTLDLPGFGKSTLPNQTWGLQQYAHCINQVITELNLHHPTLIGHSFGGAIAIKLAVSSPNLINKLILVSSSGIRHISLKRHLGWLLAKLGKYPLKLFTQSHQEAAKQWLYRSVLKETDYLETGSMAQTFTTVIHQDISADLKKISHPTLILWGDQDRDTPLWMGQTMANLIPDSQLQIINQAGHFPFLDQPEICSQAITTFLNS